MYLLFKALHELSLEEYEELLTDLPLLNGHHQVRPTWNDQPLKNSRPRSNTTLSCFDLNARQGRSPTNMIGGIKDGCCTGSKTFLIQRWRGIRGLGWMGTSVTLLKVFALNRLFRIKALISRTCGGGVETWLRSCNNPRPNSCVGAGKRFATCNPQPCPRGAKDFRWETSGIRKKIIKGKVQFEFKKHREEQCAKFNQELFERKYYDWIPYLKAPRKCELNCMPKGERFYYRHAKKVTIVMGNPSLSNMRLLPRLWMELLATTRVDGSALMGSACLLAVMATLEATLRWHFLCRSIERWIGILRVQHWKKMEMNNWKCVGDRL